MYEIPIQNIDSIFVILTITVVSLVFGSFATAVAYRVPRGEQFVSGRSKCPSCGHNLNILDLFPVFSWLFLRGKCRYCGVQFGSSYPVSELLLTLMILTIYMQMGIVIPSVILAILSVCLIILIIIDFEHYIIPDGLNFTMFIVGLAYQYSLGSSLFQFIASPIIWFSIGLGLRWIIYFWKKQEGLGLGDVKFFAVVGIFIPADLLTISTFFFLSGILSILTSIILRKNKFPFGPSLALALYTCLIWPDFQNLWHSYISNIIRSL